MKNSSEWIRRLFLSATVTVLVAVVMAFLSSCSMYKSNGRKTFEDRAPDNLTNTNVGQSVDPVEKDSDTCWTQPLKEPLWDMPQNAEVRVHSVSNELIEACLVPQD